MYTKLAISSTLLTLFMFSALLPAQTLQSLEEGLSALSEQISSGMATGDKKKIVIIEFSDLDGRINELGKFVSEELITRLFITRRFKVVERQLLNKILKEHELTLSGLVDVNTAKKLGGIFGADAICSGTITDLERSIKINARLISCETGSIFAVAACQIAMDEVIQKLMGNYGSFQSGSNVGIPNIRSGEIFYKEDFSSVVVGTIPPDWIGGDKLIVKNDGRRNYMTDFEERNMHRVTITNVAFPPDFELKSNFQFGQNGRANLYIHIGNVKVTVNGFGWCALNESKSKKDVDYRNRIVQIALIKDNDTFTLLVNGQQRVLGRYPEFVTPTEFSIEFEGFTLGLREIPRLKLLDIVGTAI